MAEKPKLTPREYIGYSILEIARIATICFTVSIVGHMLFSDQFILMAVGIIAGVIVGLTSAMLYFPATLLALWVVWPLLAFGALFDQKTIGALIVTTFMCMAGAFMVFARLYRIGNKLNDKNPLNR
ncbi:MAG: hypothetical protein G01um10143_231 [Parcubacteria group bacterium Gr01-1014_3]|nr:MAG: hypothetical protein G01um10143_231 [Parcubacteria group bacterium Gr01-1014_3]